MKYLKLIRNIILLFFLCSITLFISYKIGNNYLNKFTSKDRIFVWGDSQMAFGLDIKKLSNLTEKSVISAANNGNGVADFLEFVQHIPKKSTVILSISKPMQLRQKYMDRNLSGISLFTISTLFAHNFSLKEILKIIRNNKKPRRIFHKKNKLFSYKENITFSESIDFYKKVYEKTPTFLSDKQAIIIKGIDILQQKKCTLLFIDFPYHKLLDTIEKKSDTYISLKRFNKLLINKLSIITLDTLHFKTTKETMHDLTHLNEIGATEIAKKIASMNLKNNTFLTIEL